MLKIKTFQGRTLARGAALVLRNELYVPGWLLKPELEQCVSDKEAYDGTLLVGFIGLAPVAQLLRSESNLLMAYVRPDQRRKGYGARLVAEMKRICPGYELTAGCGITGTQHFWKKSNITIDWYYGLGIPEPTRE